MSVAVVAKKILAYLASNEKGRKFLGYVVGIVVFLVLLPVIVLVGFFGWMSGEDSGIDLKSEIFETLQANYSEQFPEHTVALETIETTFVDLEMSNFVSLAQFIYIESELPSANVDEDFYTTYAECFLNVGDEKTLTDRLSETFGITFSEEDAEIINEIYRNEVKN